MDKKLLLVSIVLLGSPAHAHHSFPANYLLDELVEVEGTVTDFVWRNPHCFLYVEVPSDSGEPVTWVLELANTVFATQAGWTAQTFQPGDELAVAGNPARTGAKRLRGTSIDRAADGFSYRARALTTTPGQSVGAKSLDEDEP